MSTIELRRRAKKAIDQLSGDRLQIVADFLPDVKNGQSDRATSDLLQIPGFWASFQRGTKDRRAGKMTNWRKVRDDV